MSAITVESSDRLRDFDNPSLPTTGTEYRIMKADLRALFVMIDTALSAIGIGGADIKVDTQANLFADLAHAAGTIALVYGDADPDKRDLYQKAGASGSGSWTQLNISLPVAFAEKIDTLYDALATLNLHYLHKSADYTALAGAQIGADTEAGGWTLSLPASPQLGDRVQVIDFAGTFDLHNLIIFANGNTFDDGSTVLTCDVADDAFELVWRGPASGRSWHQL